MDQYAWVVCGMNLEGSWYDTVMDIGCAITLGTQQSTIMLLYFN